jgi:hypothetical protein
LNPWIELAEVKWVGSEESLAGLDMDSALRYTSLLRTLPYSTDARWPDLLLWGALWYDIY